MLKGSKKATFKRCIAMALSLMLVVSVLAGCGSKKEESSGESTSNGGKVINIYSWNETVKETYEATYGKTHPDVKVNWVITPTEGNAYQNKLDQDLPNQDKAKADDKIDIFCLEADYILKYVDTEYTLDLQKDLGLTDEDLSEQYEYTKEVATDSKGALKGTSYEANPGVFVYRRSIAKDVLGTDDPDEVQKALEDWTKFGDVAEQASAKGYKMLSGYDDSFRTFGNNVKAPWVNENDEIVVDDAIDEWIDQTKDFTDKGYNNKTQLWSTEWSADQGPAGKVFGFFYSTWGVQFTLLGNALETPVEEGGKLEVGNGLFGDYAICYGPADYYWGGTWLAAAKGTDNAEEVADIFREMTTDGETMKTITQTFDKFTNNKKAMEEYADSGITSAFLGGQNHIKMFLDVAPNVSMENVSPYDQGMNEALQQAFKDYYDGKVSKDEAYDNFFDAVIEKYPNLSRADG
ncbi:MAG: ABC transporter substrate-binding protein [Clostridiales Family XIII bacterium]|jgi:hypothetical protein|nr:ABC transporter substrate-binding protein [Clostridiales Family XIII bacterium]